MSTRRLSRAGLVLAALLGLATAHAQPSLPRVTDVGPPPAESRDSAGAIVLENSMVRAQREKAFAQSAGRTGIASVGQHAGDSRTRATTVQELATARAAETTELRRKGAASLTGR
jgi:hypothetical protein